MSVLRVLVVMATMTATPALLAYERLAPVYDDFTDGYDHDAWIDRLEQIARNHGANGPRLLDVACGTGKSFAPLIERGYDVWACDISPAMIERARLCAGIDPDRVLVADMRALPELGAFELVTCLDDAVNYLLEVEDLVAAFAERGAPARPGRGLPVRRQHARDLPRGLRRGHGVRTAARRRRLARGDDGADPYRARSAQPRSSSRATTEARSAATSSATTRSPPSAMP